MPLYFGNYRRLVYLAQSDDKALRAAARRAAQRLGLKFEYRRTGFGELAMAISARGHPTHATFPAVTL